MQTIRSVEPSKAMHSAVEILLGEHTSCTAVLKGLISHLDRARLLSFKPRLETFSTSLNFIGTFLDQFHHPKEDEFLFLALRRHTTEADEVLRDLQYEHAHGADFLEELNTALERARSGGAGELHEFTDMMKRYMKAHVSHMEREETLVLPIACRLLVEEDWQEIDRAFRANRDPLFSAKPPKVYRGIFHPDAHGVY